jgi:tetratricopeptide (TPR) repeat protein
MKRQLSKYYLAGAVSLGTFIIYLSSLRNEFINWDDIGYVVDNPHIRSLDFSFLKWSFFHFYASNWHPLTWISHAVDYALWGSNPFGHHLTSIILHAVNTFLVVLLVVKLADASRDSAVIGDTSVFTDRRAILIAAGVAGVLFGLHPLHVESVAWISERKDLLCALFFLLSIMTYSRYETVAKAEREIKRACLGRWYLFTIGCFILALLSKPMAVSLPLVLLLLDWYPFGRIRSLRTFRIAFIEKLPFFALSIVSSVLTFLAQKSRGAVASAELMALSTRLLVAFRSLIMYLWKMILPLNLAPYYPYQRNVSLLSLKYLLAVVLVIGITLICIVLFKKRKLFLAAWGYYVVTLLPVIGVVQVGQQAMADRYTYLPSLGPFLIAGLAAAWGYKKVRTLEKWGRLVRLLGVATAIAVVFSLSYLTFEQIGVWNNSIRFWSYAIDKEQGVPLLFYQRGYAFFTKGRFDRAIADFSRAVELYPSFDKAYMMLGASYGEVGLLDKAIENSSKAIMINPDAYMAYNDRAVVYLLTRQYDNALGDFNKAIELNRSYALPYLNRGRLFLERGNRMLAMADFQKACELGNKVGCDKLKTLQRTAAKPGR